MSHPRILRQRSLAGSCAVPAAVGVNFPQAQTAVLSVIANEVRRHGVCALAVDSIADLAGCGCTTVQTACRRAVQLGYLSVTRQHGKGGTDVPNAIRLIDAGWAKRAALSDYRRVQAAWREAELRRMSWRS